MKYLVLILGMLGLSFITHAKTIEITLGEITEPDTCKFTAKGNYATTDTVDLIFFFNLPGVGEIDRMEIHHTGGAFHLDSFFIRTASTAATYDLSISENFLDGTLPELILGGQFPAYQPPWARIFEPGTQLAVPYKAKNGHVDIQIQAESQSDTLPWQVHYELTRNGSVVASWDTSITGSWFSYNKRFDQWYSGDFILHATASNKHADWGGVNRYRTLTPIEPALNVTASQVDIFWNAIAIQAEGLVYTNHPHLVGIFTDTMSGEQITRSVALDSTEFNGYYVFRELREGRVYDVEFSITDSFHAPVTQTLEGLITKSATDDMTIRHIKYRAEESSTDSLSVTLTGYVNPKGHGPTKVSLGYQVNNGIIHWMPNVHETGYKDEEFTLTITIPKNSTLTLTYFAESLLDESMTALDTTIVNLLILDVPEIQNSSMMFYPNPSADGHFTTTAQYQKITVFDQTGKEVLSTSEPSFTLEQSGMYIVRGSYDSGETFYSRIIMQ